MASIQFTGRDPGHIIEPRLNWLFPAAIVLIAAALAVLGESGAARLRYDRAALENGEFWRLLSGHFVHLGWSHFFLNATGLLLVWALVGARLPTRGWLAVCLLVIVGIDLSFWFLKPALSWYVGLSGVLHGLFTAGVVAGWYQARKETLIIAAVLVVKLAYEQWSGPLPGSETASGGSVVVDAHLYGAISGALAALAHLIRVRRPRSI